MVSSAASHRRAIKARKELNKAAYERFRRNIAMQARKTAARFTSLAAVEIVLIVLIFLFF